MKKRQRIYSLLHKFSDKSGVMVTIKGSASGSILFMGRIWDVPYGLCTDYVKSYHFVGSRLEIVSTCSMYDIGESS